jgi:hypothetical protein
MFIEIIVKTRPSPAPLVRSGTVCGMPGKSTCRPAGARNISQRWYYQHGGPGGPGGRLYPMILCFLSVPSVSSC